MFTNICCLRVVITDFSRTVHTGKAIGSISNGSLPRIRVHFLGCDAMTSTLNIVHYTSNREQFGIQPSPRKLKQHSCYLPVSASASASAS